MSEQQDLLKQCFERQSRFQERLGRQLPTLPDFGQVDTANMHLMLEGVKENALALMMESSELLDWTPWKHWSQKSGNKQVDQDQLGSENHVSEMRIEVVDGLCFLLNCAMCLGMDAEMLAAGHAEKMEVNYQRQDRGGY